LERAVQPTFEDLHRLACRLLEASEDPTHQDQVKPFAVWPLRAAGTLPDRTELRLNWLHPEQDPLPRLRAGLRRPLRLGGAHARPLTLRTQGTSYLELRRRDPIWQCDLRFLSPTYFARSGRDYLLPDPELIVRRLAARWNQHAGLDGPLGVRDDQARELARRVILKAHELHTVRVGGQDGRERTGFLGQIRLALRTAERRDPEALVSAQLLATLTGFAPFCGLGAQTTHGLGAVATFPVHG
jgi:CRISPR-associated endoribonuclease Cas6